MGEGRPSDNDVKDTEMNSGAGGLSGAPSIGEAFGGWYKNWRPWTVVGWGIKNSIEKTFGAGAAEQGAFENLKIRLVNMASKVIGILKESLGAETQKNGEEILAKEKAARKGAGSIDLSGVGPTEKAVPETADKEAGTGKGLISKAKSPVISKDISATIAKAAAKKAVPGGMALISDKGLDLQMPDIGNGR